MGDLARRRASADDRFALICKTHHALVDGISGVDIMTVLFDLDPDPPEPEPAPPWAPRPFPERAELLAAALARAGRGAVRARARGALGTPIARARRPGGGRRAGRDGFGRDRRRAALPAERAHRAAPALRLGVERPATFKAIKDALGGTINDVVLTVVAGALRAHLFRHGRDPEGLELKAMVPISVRADADRGALGNQVAAMYAPLPVGLEDPVERFRFVHGAMKGLKESGQAVGAQAITRLADAAAPTVLDQAARLQSRQRFFNLTVTNVPGPQVPLYVLGPRLLAFYPEGAAGPEHRARDRDHVLRRARVLRAAGRLRRAGRHRRARGRPGAAIRELAAIAGAPVKRARARRARRSAREARPDRDRRGGGRGDRLRRADLGAGVARLEPGRR